MSVEDKVVIITGATGTLGQVVVRKFAEQGARLALFGRSIEHLEELASGLGLPEESHLLHAADFSDPRAAQTATEAVIQKFGRAEIILHLVGGFTGGKSVIDVRGRRHAQHDSATRLDNVSFGPVVHAPSDGERLGPYSRGLVATRAGPTRE